MENKELLYYPILDSYREKAQEIEKKIQEGLYKDLNLTDNEEEANAYLVGGGDGFMLDTIKKKYDFEKLPEENKLFFGINCGTLGFLLNDVNDITTLPKTMEEIDKVKAHLMKVEILKMDAQKEIKYAINDVVIGGNLLDYFKFDITSGQVNKRFHGTGVIVSTALGSSAYWLNNGGPILPAESQLRGISGLASLPFGHQVIKPEEMKIKIKGRTPIMVGVDGYGGRVDDVQELTLSPTQHYATIAFFKDTPFDTKRMLLAEEKLLREDF
ncbi:MAG: hypothetical protein NT085_04985 [candidate division SR1 bacterium]|nr:hypothetical protein [candidate division SR1 bacterium]